MKLGVEFEEIEEGETIVNDRVNIGNESLETLRSAMAFKVKSKTSETHLSKEDGSGLEGPADVVAIAMDHEDESARRGRRKGKP